MENNEVKLRSQIDDKYKWTIDKIFSSTEEWEKAFTKLKNDVESLDKFNSQLNVKGNILNFLKEDERLSRQFEKLYVYANLKYDEDRGKTSSQGLKDRVSSFMAHFLGIKSFFVPELMSLPECFINEEMNSSEEMKQYEFYINKILREKEHILSKNEEKLLASVSECLEGPSNIFGIFTNVDIEFPHIKDENGNDVVLTEGCYSLYLKSKNREVRKSAFSGILATYNKYRNTLAATYTSSVKNNIFEAKARKYKSSLELSLNPNNIPVDVYDNTVDSINSGLAALHRYVDVKKKLLKLDEIHMYDLYAPLYDTPSEHIEFDEGVKIALKALKPLCGEYLDIFKNGIDSGWVDIYENKGKRSGAYSWGTYDTLPYILMNYHYQLNDVSTLVHEMGHSLHSYYSRKYQPYIYNEYTLFCAEVASTVNESLLLNYLIDNEKDKNRKLFLINQQLEQIRTTVFRQVMFAEFERDVHKKIEDTEALSADDLCSMYHDLNTKYFGNNIIIDSEIDMEWARIPHFYRDFYVYQYATGYSAATAFVSKILKHEDGAVLRYLDFLKKGGSDYSINLLRNAGVNMLTPEPVNAVIKRFNELLDMLESSDS